MPPRTRKRALEEADANTPQAKKPARQKSRAGKSKDKTSESKVKTSKSKDKGNGKGKGKQKDASPAQPSSPPSDGVQEEHSSDTEDDQPAAPPSDSDDQVHAPGFGPPKDTPDDADPYEYVTICRPIQEIEQDNNKKPEEERMSEQYLRKNVYHKEGGGCVCSRLLSERPDWKWTMMREGVSKICDARIEVTYRDPDNFGMYVYNDFAGAGIQEVIENQILEFNAAKTYKAQWRVLSTFAYWFTTEDHVPYQMWEDSECINAILDLVGCAFLSMLNTLDRQALLEPDSEIKDLGLVMGMFMEVATFIEGCGPGQTWPEHIVVYAKENDIPMTVPIGVEELVDQNDAEAELPKPAVDRWGWKKALREFVLMHGKSTRAGQKPKIGGHHTNITKWASAMRKTHNFDHEDPLPREIRDALKRGEQIRMA